MAEVEEQESASNNLRRQAEEQMRRQDRQQPELPAEPAGRLVEELRLHQIELEMQNKELQRTQRRLEASREQYVDLFDFAPMGYFILDKYGIIHNLNLMGARLLAGERSSLVGRNFGSFVDPASKELYAARLKNLFDSYDQQAWELTLINLNGQQFYGRLQSIVVPDDEGRLTRCRTALTDITAQKQTTEALQESQQRLQRVIDNAPLVLFATDRQGTITVAEGQGFRSLKTDPAEAVGQNLFDMFSNHPQILENARRVLAGETFKTQVKLPHGPIFDTDYFPLYDHTTGQVSGLIGVAMDVTEQKRVEEMLATSAEIGEEITAILESDALLQVIVTQINRRFHYETVSLYLPDPTEGALACRASVGRDAGLCQEGRLYFKPENKPEKPAGESGPKGIAGGPVPETGYRLALGPDIRSELNISLKSREHLLGVLSLQSRAEKAFSHHDRLAMEALSHHMATAIENARLFQAEKLQRERATILAETAGLVSQNLTKTQLLDRLLVNLRRLVAFDSTALILIDGGELVVEAGHGFEIDLVGRRFSLAADRLGEEMLASKSYVTIEDTLADPRYQRWPGAEKVRSWMSAPLLVASVMIGCLTADRHRVEPFTETEAELVQAFAHQAAQAIYNARLTENLSQVQARLVEQERLAALGQMAATVAHEMRNPLMGVRMGVEYFSRDLPADDPRQRGAVLMQRNIERIDRIVEDILFLGRAPQPVFEINQLRPIIENELARWQALLADKNITLGVELAVDLPPVRVDKEQFGRALSNLLSNSLEALPPGGELHLSLKGEGDNQLIILADNGPGIGPEQLEHIFEPFYTTKTRGTGLGLAIVKQILERHSAQISVSSEIGKGTQFTIRLPSDEG